MGRPMTTTAPWYVEAFRSDYLDVYAHRDDAAASREVRGALDLLRFDASRGGLLDLACGAGRHSEAFRIAGCAVTCLDLSADLIVASAARGLPSVRADMRALPFADWSFAGVAVLFSSFGYFFEEGDHAVTLGEIARVLEPGGAVLIDLMDVETVRYTLVPQSVDMLDGMTIEVERRFIERGPRVEKQIRLIRDGSATRSWTESVRLFSPRDIVTLAEGVGLLVERVVGAYDGRPHVPGETRQLVVLRKPREKRPVPAEGGRP